MSSTHRSSPPATAWFKSADDAVKTTCNAYWVGLYIDHTQRKQLQWETRAQFATGTGQIASIVHSAAGYRVAQCRAALYTHG